MLEKGKTFLDLSDTHIIYVNSTITNETDMGRLMNDFRCVDYREMRYDALRNRVKYFKDEREGIMVMREYVEEWEIAAMEKGRKEGFEAGKIEGIEKGIDEGIKQERRNMVVMLSRNGFSKEKIAEMMQISLDEVSQCLSLQ